MRRVSLPLVLTSAAMIAASSLGTAQENDARLLERARRLHAEAPLIDGHNDLPWEMRTKSGYDFSKIDIRLPQPQLQTDIPRLKAGMLGGQFWSVYVPGTMQGQKAVTATLEQMDAVHNMVRLYPDTFELARTADDVERIFKRGKIASLIGMEGGHSIDSSLGALRMFHRLGAGYMTLTHNVNLPWADAAAETPRLGGLSRFGEEVVHEMNRLAMLVDLSHVSPDTMEDAIRVSAAPIIFSHSSVRAICDHHRNVPDEVLRLLSKNGGVVMVSFVPGFTSPECGPRRQAELEIREQHANDAAALDAALKQFRTGYPEPKATLSQVADHIDHVRKVAGIDHVGIGSDFDGITSTPVGLEDVSKYPALTAELLRRGYSDAEVRKVLGKNILRVMREAEATAKKLQAQRGPSLKTLEELDGKAPTPATR